MSTLPFIHHKSKQKEMNIYVDVGLAALVIAGCIWLFTSYKKQVKQDASKFDSLYIRIGDTLSWDEWSKVYKECVDFLSGTKHPKRSSWNSTLDSRLMTQYHKIRSSL